LNEHVVCELSQSVSNEVELKLSRRIVLICEANQSLLGALIDQKNRSSRSRRLRLIKHVTWFVWIDCQSRQ